MARVASDANWVVDDSGIAVGQRLADGSVAAPFVDRSYTAAQLATLAAAGGLTPRAVYVASDTGAQAVAASATELVYTGSRGQPLSLRDYFTPAQWTAITTNVWTGIDISDVSSRFEGALAAAYDNRMLVGAGQIYIKVNRPIRFDGRLMFRGLGTYNGLTIYPDLSVDWPVTFPNRGVLETSNYQFPTNPIYNPTGDNTAAAWAGSKPDYSFHCRLEHFAVRCHQDPLQATYPERVPDYGIVVHCANEAWSANGVYVFRARKANWLFSGLQSTPALYDCGAFQAGYKCNTIFGDAVTRTTGGAFGANVFVYSTPTPGAASAVLLLEAAAATDLDSIIAGNVLTIGGVGYTVASVGAASQSINQITFIGGSRTDTRYVRLVTLNASPTLPAATGNIMRGRVFHAGLALAYVPGDASRFASVVSSDGGNSTGGAIRLYDFSGDSNRDTMVLVEGGGTVTLMGLKAEYNPSAVVFTGSANGGSKPKLVLGGYRISSGGVWVSDSQPGLDQSVIRVAGGVSRPSVVSLGGQADVAYAKFIQDLSTSLDLGVTNVTGGQGFVHWCADYGEPAHIANLGGRQVDLTSDQATFGASAASNANYRFRWRMVYGTGYRFQVGPAGSEQTVIEVTGSSTPTAVKFKGYNGASMVDMLTFDNTGKLGFFATTPAQAQSTGWGTPTGASKLSSFPGATATLSQCSGAIAQIIADLKAWGLYGA